MSRRHKKKHPAASGNQQSRNVNAQSAEKLEDGSASVTRDGDPDKHDKAGKQQQPAGRYQRVRAYLRQSWNANRIIALGTIALGVVGVGSLILTYMTLKASIAQFVFAERARVVLGDDKGVIMEFKDFGDKTRLVIHMRNEGHTVAYNLSLKTQSLVAPPNDSFAYSKFNPAKGAFDTGVMVGSNASYTDYSDFPRDVATLVKNGTKGLRIVGRVKYWDEFGKQHCFPIGLIYQRIDDRFSPVLTPPTESVCDPRINEGETFSVNSAGTMNVNFSVRKFSDITNNQPEKDEN